MPIAHTLTYQHTDIPMLHTNSKHINIPEQGQLEVTQQQQTHQHTRTMTFNSFIGLMPKGGQTAQA